MNNDLIRSLKVYKSEYIHLNTLGGYLKQFEDGVYHILGEKKLLEFRLHHMIGIKINDKMLLLDYATDFKIYKPLSSVCKTNNINTEFKSDKTKNKDLMGIFLGKITSKEF